jgi:hypothetical protein
MAGGFYGADVDSLRRLAKQFESAADQLNSVTSTLTTDVNSASAWKGPDASEFRSDWNGTRTSQLKAAVAALRSGGADLVRNADEQNAASTDASGGASGSAGSPFAGSSASGSGSAAGGTRGHGNGDTTVGLPGIFTASGGASAHGFDVTGDHATFNTGIKDGDLKTSADAGWNWGAGAEAHGKTDLMNGLVTNEGDANAYAGLQSDAGLSQSIGPDGIQGDIHAHGMVGGVANAHEHSDLIGGAVQSDTTIHAMAGGEATFTDSGTFGPQGAGVNAGLDAFAGAKIGAHQAVDVGGATVGLGAEAWAGVGYKANLDADVTYDKVAFSVDAGAALGLGADLKLDYSFSPKEAVDNVARVFGF